MTALATSTDVEAVLGRTLTAEESGRVDSLLTLASSEVEAVTGRRFAPGDYTVSRVVRGGRVVLPATVDEVIAVSIVNCDGTTTDYADFTARRATVYGLPAGSVEIDFTVSAPVPDVIVKLVAGIVAASMEAPPIGVTAETAGPFQRSFVSSSGRVWLTKSDRTVLARYTVPKPALSVL